MDADQLQQFDLTYMGILRELDSTLPPEWHASLSGQVSAIRTVLSEYQAQAAEVRQSGDYSPQGKARRLSDLRRQFATKLAAHRKQLAAYDERLAVEQRKLNGAVAKGRDDVLLAELRAQEIRRWAREMDPLTLTAQYLSMASDTRRHDAMRAIEDAPLPLLDEATIAQGQAQRTRHLAPEAVQTLEHLGTMRKVLADAIDSGLSVVAPNGSDPLQHAAQSGETPATP